jgi:hypothetical protein
VQASGSGPGQAGSDMWKQTPDPAHPHVRGSFRAPEGGGPEIIDMTGEAVPMSPDNPSMAGPSAADVRSETLLVYDALLPSPEYLPLGGPSAADVRIKINVLCEAVI